MTFCGCNDGIPTLQDKWSIRDKPVILLESSTHKAPEPKGGWAQKQYHLIQQVSGLSYLDFHMMNAAPTLVLIMVDFFIRFLYFNVYNFSNSDFFQDKPITEIGWTRVEKYEQKRIAL
ncbi:hypothetical protein BY458DRAFT_493397 [Sporodiniella umbellata]|nr:hypothetical protein BY458DRAFT_493397 [Sporodiniella umbellata]